MLEQNETNEYWPGVWSHRRNLHYQPGLLLFVELEVLVKASSGIVFSHCLMYLKLGELVRMIFILQLKGGASVTFWHCGLALTSISLDIPKERQCETGKVFIEQCLNFSTKSF